MAYLRFEPGIQWLQMHLVSIRSAKEAGGEGERRPGKGGHKDSTGTGSGQSPEMLRTWKMGPKLRKCRLKRDFICRLHIQMDFLGSIWRINDSQGLPEVTSTLPSKKKKKCLFWKELDPCFLNPVTHKRKHIPCPVLFHYWMHLHYYYFLRKCSVNCHSSNKY